MTLTKRQNAKLRADTLTGLRHAIDLVGFRPATLATETLAGAIKIIEERWPDSRGHVRPKSRWSA